MSISSHDSPPAGFSLFPLHIRRVWVSEGKNALSSRCRCLSYLPRLLSGAAPAFPCSPPCSFRGRGGRGETRAACLERGTKERRTGTARSLSLPASLRQCVPPTLPPPSLSHHQQITRSQLNRHRHTYSKRRQGCGHTCTQRNWSNESMWQKIQHQLTRSIHKEIEKTSEGFKSQ